MEHLFLLILSVLSAYGIAVALVQKGDEWPIKWLVDPLKKLLGKINPQAPKMFDCIVCMSFWTALLTDIILAVATRKYWAWPLSGFITLGFAWTVMEFFNALDKSKAVAPEVEKGLDEALNITEEHAVPVVKDTLSEPLPRYERDLASIAHVVSRGDGPMSLVEGEEVPFPKFDLQPTPSVPNATVQEVLNHPQ